MNCAPLYLSFGGFGLSTNVQRINLPSGIKAITIAPDSEADAFILRSESIPESNVIPYFYNVNGFQQMRTAGRIVSCDQPYIGDLDQNIEIWPYYTMQSAQVAVYGYRLSMLCWYDYLAPLATKRSPYQIASSLTASGAGGDITIVNFPIYGRKYIDVKFSLVTHNVNTRLRAVMLDETNGYQDQDNRMSSTPLTGDGAINYWAFSTDVSGASQFGAPGAGGGIVNQWHYYELYYNGALAGDIYRFWITCRD